MKKLFKVTARRWWSLKDRKYARLVEEFINWRMKGGLNGTTKESYRQMP